MEHMEFYALLLYTFILGRQDLSPSLEPAVLGIFLYSPTTVLGLQVYRQPLQLFFVLFCCFFTWVLGKDADTQAYAVHVLPAEAVSPLPDKGNRKPY